MRSDGWPWLRSPSRTTAAASFIYLSTKVGQLVSFGNCSHLSGGRAGCLLMTVRSVMVGQGEGE